MTEFFYFIGQRKISTEIKTELLCF
ncbi:unnamed protein product [Spirodela intermedia]|uniref:Uncharacterized protein n=1 Tax=Spirodela intermedia TaxID=51605 RepID=A0A7I8LAV5_SPIIN|nr:unnamed protein product [Spirodela intermedia]